MIACGVESAHPAVMRPARDRTEAVLLAALIVVTLALGVTTVRSVEAALAQIW